MKQQIWVATVQIAVVADSEAEACDSMTETLTNNLKYNGAIVDWQHADQDSPALAGTFDTDTLEEGEIFQKKKSETDTETSALIPAEYPAETFQKIRRSDLKPRLLELLQNRAWFTAGNVTINYLHQIEKEFFIMKDELDLIVKRLGDESSFEARKQALELQKINVSYFHIIDQ